MAMEENQEGEWEIKAKGEEWGPRRNLPAPSLHPNSDTYFGSLHQTKPQ